MENIERFLKEQDFPFSSVINVTRDMMARGLDSKKLLKNTPAKHPIMKRILTEGDAERDWGQDVELDERGGGEDGGEGAIDEEIEAIFVDDSSVELQFSDPKILRVLFVR